MNYNLESRTSRFGEIVIDFCKSIKPGLISDPIVRQLVRSSTSVGANYMEANQASSRRDFSNKIRICQKEANETKHWLKMVSVINDDYKNTCLYLYKEAHELTLIFAAISRSLNKKFNIKN
ncbi:MAG: four helix bundle protein [Candidatus Falkowbacteria bacterium]|nr:four helix bundle protein [Candidatus Falkowbacteria bacterium]